MTSWLDDAGVQESIQSAILHHSPKDVTSIHYRRSNREDRLRAAWQLWAKHVEAMVSGRPRGTTSSNRPVPTIAAIAVSAES
jgi:hypothetical protein